MTLKCKLKLETLGYMIAVLFWYIWQYINWNGDYLDTDNYFYALRATEMLQHQYWAEHIFPYTNYPLGEISHWTRAFDLFMILFSLPFIGYMPLHSAVFFGGMFIAPFFGILAAYYTLKCCRLIMTWKYRLCVFILLFIQANVMREIVLNRPDHHAVFVFLTAFIFYKIIKFIQKKQLKDITMAAVMAAFSLWMAAEGIFLFMTAAAFLFYGVCCLGCQYNVLKRFCLVYTCFSTLFWVINPPYQGYLFMDSGRISLFYILAFWWMVGFIFIAGYLQRQIYKIFVLTGGAILLLLTYYCCGWLISPLDERIITPFVARISEMEAGNLYTLAYPIVAMICSLFMIRKNINQGVFMFLLINLWIYGILTIFTRRFLPYSGFCAALVLVLFLSHRKKVWGWVLLFILLEPLSFTVYALTDKMKVENPLFLPVKNISYLPQGAVVSDIFLSPYIIWYFQRPTVASPYHRNVEGILDNHDILFSSDEAYVIELLKKHKVGSILLLPTSIDDQYYIEPMKNCDKLYGKILGCHNYPSWLKLLHEGDYYLLQVQLVQDGF